MYSKLYWVITELTVTFINTPVEYTVLGLGKVSWLFWISTRISPILCLSALHFLMIDLWQISHNRQWVCPVPSAYDTDCKKILRTGAIWTYNIKIAKSTCRCQTTQYSLSTCVHSVCVISAVNSRQVAASGVLLLGAVALGTTAYLFTDLRQRRTYLETRKVIEVKTSIEEQSRTRVSSLTVALALTGSEVSC